MHLTGKPSDTLPIFDTVIDSWTDGIEAIKGTYKTFLLVVMAMVGLFITGIVLGVVVLLFARHGQPVGSKVAVAAPMLLLSIVYSTGFVVMFAVPAIAVHRYLLLGEQAPPNDDRRAKRVMRYIGYMMLMAAAAVLPVMVVVMAAAAAVALKGTGWSGLGLGVGLLGLLAMAAAGVVLPRFAILFPAVALDGWKASLANAWADTRGQTWRIFAVTVLTQLPVTLGLLLLLAIVGRAGPAAPVLSVGSLLIWGLLQTAVVAAKASNVYNAFADRLRVAAKPLGRAL